MTKVKKEKKKVLRSIAKVLNKNDRVQRRLLGMNPYAQTLLDPFNHMGVKIPDENLTPSVAFSIVDRRTLTVNSAGIAGCCYGFRTFSASTARGSLVPVSIVGDPATQQYTAGMTFGTSATTGDLTAGALGTTGPLDIIFSQWSNGTPTIPAAFDKVRLVSAGLNVQFTGNFTNNSGKYSCAFVPRGTSRSKSGLSIPLTYVQQLPDSRTIPINQNQGCTVRYEPLDPYSNRYVQTNLNYAVSGAQDWETLLGHAEGGELWVAIDGSILNTTFQVTFVGNYEAIPLTNSFLLQSMASTSHSDPIGFSHALNLSAQAPSVVGSSAAANGIAMNAPNKLENVTYHPAPPTSGTGQGNGGGMMDSIFGALSNAPDLINKVSGAIEKFSPLIEEGLAMLAI